MTLNQQDDLSRALLGQSVSRTAAVLPMDGRERMNSRRGKDFS
jgi:hypothetical protein